jgi:hypothetical protein
MIAVNDESVFPLPVGAQTRVFVPSSINGIAPFCGGVKRPPFSGTNSPNCSIHHARTSGESRLNASASSMSIAPES